MNNFLLPLPALCAPRCNARDTVAWLTSAAAAKSCWFISLDRIKARTVAGVCCCILDEYYCIILYTVGIPDRFCWTRFGTEAGESIEHILNRKEEERLANGGI